ncbi:MAG: hypothetical protein V3V00_00615 [Saprospiraceae bacterium]
MNKNSDTNIDHKDINWNKWYIAIVVINILFILLVHFSYSLIN